MRRLLLLGLAAGLGCSGGLFSKDTGRILPAVGTEGEDQLRFAMVFGDESGVSITVTERPWSASTKRVSVQHSALFVQIHHEGSEPVRYREDDFVLRSATEDHAGVAIERLVTNSGAGLQEARLAKTMGVRAATLEPGQDDEGFVFFRKKFQLGDFEQEDLALELTLYDVAHETALETLRLPLVVVE